MKVMGQELTGKLGTPEEYAKAFKTMIEEKGKDIC